MTTPDYKSLCAELLDALEDHQLYEGAIPAVARARAALAAEAVGPSDEELTLTYAYAVTAAVGNRRGPFKKEDAEAAQLAGLRAVLARYSAPLPIPVSERLPGAVDCDAEGRCWWGESCETGATWEFYAAAPTTALWSHWLPFSALPTPAQEGADG